MSLWPSTVNGITKQTAVRVAGSKLTLQAVPATPSPGQTVILTVYCWLTRRAIAIPNVPVKLGGTLAALLNQTITTNLAGSASASFAAPAASGVYTVTGSGSGVSAADYQIQVFIERGTGRGNSGGPHRHRSLRRQTCSPSMRPGRTSNRSTLRFLFVDSSNNPIKNVRVRFVDVTTGLPAIGASFSSGTSTLFTDASGTVSRAVHRRSELQPHQRGDREGLLLGKRLQHQRRQQYRLPCGAASVTALLTVAGQALAVSIGDDNVLQTGTGTYIKRFAVTVADAAGVRSPGRRSTFR